MTRINVVGFTRVCDQRRPRQRRTPHPTQGKAMTRYSSYFHGYCYTCNQFGRRDRECRVIPKGNTNYVRKNPFDPLVDMNVIYYNCDNFGHITRNYRKKFIRSNVQFEKKKNTNPKMEKESKGPKEEGEKIERKPKKKWQEKVLSSTKYMISQNTLHAKKQNLCVIDSGYSKHMTGDRGKFIELKSYKEGSVSLRDNTTIKIFGKGIFSLDGKNKTKDVV